MTNVWPVEGQRLSGLSKIFKELFEEVGESRFAKGVEAIVADRRYSSFPTPAEFRNYVPEAPKRKYCGNCIDGWIYVPDYEARRLYNNTTANAMARCQCMRQA